MILIILYAVLSLVALFLLYTTIYFVLNFVKIPKHVPYKFQFFSFFPIQIPLLSGYAYVGNHHTIMETAQSNFAKPHKAFYFAGGGANMHCVYCANANDIKLLMIARAGKIRKPVVYEATEVFGEHIVSAPEYAQWRKHRLLCNPAFTDDHLRFVAQTSVQSFHLLDAQWSKQQTISNGIVINPAKDMARLTFDVIGKVGFGCDLHVLDETPKPLSNGHSLSFADALEKCSNSLIILRSLIPKLLWSLLDGPKKEVEKYLDELIEKRMHEKEKHHDLLSMMMTLNESEAIDENQDLGESHESKLGRTKLTLQEIKSDAFIFLFAGHDTTSTNLQWCMYELAMKPEIQEKMKEEVERVVGNRDPEYDFAALKYILNVAQESLRMHPPLPLVFKEVKEDMQLSNGLPLKANTIVICHVYSLHHDKDYWDEPSIFHPDRFNAPLKHPYAYLPFSTGSRSCIGSKFSLIETVLILAALVKKYSIHFHC